MTRAFYPAEVTEFSNRIKEGLRRLDDDVRGISLLGGWAVYELVEPAYAQESQDIGIVLHSTKAWTAALDYLRRQDFDWRYYKPRDEPRQRDHRLRHPKHPNLFIDVFYTNAVDHDLLRSLFATSWGTGFKDQPYDGFVPALEAILLDKFETLPKRTDAGKRLKDAVDIWALLFHNRAGLPVTSLLTGRIKSAAAAAKPHLEDVRDDPTFKVEIADVLGIL